MQDNNNTATISTQRLEAFSDGVFAIAATLLILEIKIPPRDLLSHQPLSEYLRSLLPNFFAYFFSFLMIGIFWANHHYIFKLYKRTDHTFNIINIFFLMSISFLPFPSAIFGEYMDDDMQRPGAVTFYAIGIFLPSLIWNIMWAYASHNKRLIDHRLTDEFIKQIGRQYNLSLILYLLAILISLISPIGSIILNILLALLYLLPPKKPAYT